MAQDPIRPIGVEPIGDDQQWKRDVERMLRELASRQVADRTDIDYVKGQVN